MTSDTDQATGLNQIKRPSENLYQFLYEGSGSNNLELKNKPSFCSSISSVPSLNSFEGNQSILSKQSTVSNSTTNTESSPTNQNYNYHYLTPSQRYRLRRNKNQKKLRNYIIDKDPYLYENKQTQRDSDCDLDVDDSILWNIPRTHYSYLNPLDSTNVLPTVTDIPGINVNGCPYKGLNGHRGSVYFNESKDISNMINNLSNQYGVEVSKKSKSHLRDRYQSMESLPMELKELDSLGLEDMICVSSNKLKYLNQGRPIWLPPKTTDEIESYKTELENCMDAIYKDQMERHKWLNDYKKYIEKNYETLFSYNGKKENGSNWFNNIKFLNRIVRKIPLPCELRYTIYMDLLKQNGSFESFNEVYNRYERIASNDSCYPYDKLLEIKNLIQDKCENKKIMTIDNERMLSTIFFLLKLKSISKQGLIKGDEIIIHHLIKMDKLSIEQIWNLVQIIQNTINNTYENEYERYSQETTRIMKLWETKDDYKYIYWWDIMERIDNIDLFFWILDTIIILIRTIDNSKTKQFLKFMISLPLLITQRYHYGWDTLDSIHDTNDYRLLFPGDDSTDLLHKNYSFMCKLWKVTNTL